MMPQPNQYNAPYPPISGQPQYPQQMGQYPIQQQPPYQPQMDGYPQQAPYPPQGFDYAQQPNYNYGQPTAPPPYGQDPQYYPQQQPVIMQQPMMTTQQTENIVIVQQGSVGANPQVMTCPNCREIVTSKVESSPTASTHMTACILGIIGWFCCCCCLPYCMDSCQSQKHSCPRCGTYLGEFNETSKTACLGAGALALCCACGDCDGGCCDD